MAASGVALSMPGLFGCGGSGSSAGPCDTPAFRNSLSVSPFTEVVLGQIALADAVDGRVTTARTAEEVQRIFNQHGSTEIFHRFATRKDAVQIHGGTYGWALGLDRAQLARELRMPFNPEIGLFGTYGDGVFYQEPPDFTDYPQITVPGEWTSLGLEQMLPLIHEYAATVAAQILSTGVRVNIWDIGNEVENGVAGVTVRPAFPDQRYKAPDAVDPAIGQMNVLNLFAMGDEARIAWSATHLWPYVGRLLAAAAEGIRSVDARAKFSTHIGQTGMRSPEVALAFWRTVRDAAGYVPDEIGSSYYPTLGRTFFGADDMFQWFKDLATGVHNEFDRRVFIGEYGHPSAPMSNPTYGNLFNDPVPGYTISEQGQHDFTRDLISWGVETSLLSGIRPWAPDYCLVSPGWQPMSFFTVPENDTETTKAVITAVDEVIPPGQNCAGDVG